MVDRQEDALGDWIRSIATTSEPIEFNVVVPSFDDPPFALDQPIAPKPPTPKVAPRPGPSTSWLAAAAVVAILVGVVAVGALARSSAREAELAAASTPAARATAFWRAVEAADVPAILAEVDPDVDSPAMTIFGPASTMGQQFDWYKSIGFEWQLDRCLDVSPTQANCTVSASNTWSDALGQEPISATFAVQLNDDGVVNVDDVSNAFFGRWFPEVGDQFKAWVEINHPDDAEVMFGRDTAAHPEILKLYEVNTTRFVEAQAVDSDG